MGGACAGTWVALQINCMPPSQERGMPWTERSPMSLKFEFVTLAKRPDANLRELCRRFGVSPKTAYKWVERFDHGGAPALAERSRRPHHSPTRTDAALERLVCATRREHPAWGGRKIR